MSDLPTMYCHSHCFESESPDVYRIQSDIGNQTDRNIVITQSPTHVTSIDADLDLNQVYLLYISRKNFP